MVVTKLFSRRWWLPTLLVIAGVAFLMRLGFWQLDRLEQRRAFNARVAARWQEEPFDLIAEGLPEELSDLEYRRVQVDGEFDYDNQIVLKERPRDGAPGVILVTPLVLEDGRAVMVARGWAPYNLSSPEHWPQLEEPAGAAEQGVIGLIQESQLLPSGEAPPPPAEAQTEWFLLNIDAVQPQMPYELMPVFILQLPEAGRTSMQYPVRGEPLALDEGSHFSYAIQWFMFSAILGIGYLFLVRQQEARARRPAGTEGVPDGDADLDADADGPHNAQGENREPSPRVPELPTHQGQA